MYLLSITNRAKEDLRAAIRDDTHKQHLSSFTSVSKFLSIKLAKMLMEVA